MKRATILGILFSLSLLPVSVSAQMRGGGGFRGGGFQGGGFRGGVVSRPFVPPTVIRPPSTFSRTPVAPFVQSPVQPFVQSPVQPFVRPPLAPFPGRVPGIRPFSGIRPVPIYSYPFISPFLYSQYYSGDYPIYPQDYPNYYQDNPYDYQDYGAQEATAADANTIYQLQDQVQRLSQEIE